MHDYWQALIPEYIIDKLPESQRKALEEHLKTCLECQEALDEWLAIAEVARAEASMRRRPLPPLIDVLDGNLNSLFDRTQQIEEETKMSINATPRSYDGRRISLPLAVSVVAVLVFVTLLLGRPTEQPFPTFGQGGNTAEVVVPEDPVALFEFYIEEVWNNQNTEILAQLLTVDYVHHDASITEDIVGLEATTEYVAYEHDILPDVTFASEGLAAKGNTVTGRVTMTYEAFDKTVLVNATIANRKLAETWFDVGTLAEAYNADLMSRYFDVLYSGETLLASELEPFEADYVTLHFPNGTFVRSMPSSSTANFWNMNHESCSNWEGERKFIPQGDLVVIQEIGTCSFEANFNYWGASLEPTGTSIQNQFTLIMQIAEGHVVEVWWYQNDPRFYGAIANLLSKGSNDVDNQIEAIYELNNPDPAEHMRVLAQAHVEMWNAEALSADALIWLFGHDFLFGYNEPDPTGRTSVGDYVELLSAIRRAFPDSQATVLDMIADGNNVSIQFTWTGTHTGPFEYQSISLPPTNEVVTTQGAIILNYSSGNVVTKEIWYANFPFLAELDEIAPQ